MIALLVVYHSLVLESKEKQRNSEQKFLTEEIFFEIKETATSGI